ncbi:hypothetical protein [Pyrobaculum islandicum]|nr:hypothetical protein [Pyrobaculum islandicum]
MAKRLARDCVRGVDGLKKNGFTAVIVVSVANAATIGTGMNNARGGNGGV